MKTWIKPLLKRAGAALCVALMLVFTQAAVASAVGDVEHLVVGHHKHHHMLFSDMTLDFGHGAGHHDPDAHGHHDANDGVTPGDGPSHHHHHGDLGSSSFTIATITAEAPPLARDSGDPAPDQRASDQRQFLPDRPPRTISMTT